MNGVDECHHVLPTNYLPLSDLYRTMCLENRAHPPSCLHNTGHCGYTATKLANGLSIRKRLLHKRQDITDNYCTSPEVVLLQPCRVQLAMTMNILKVRVETIFWQCLYSSLPRWPCAGFTIRTPPEPGHRKRRSTSMTPSSLERASLVF